MEKQASSKSKAIVAVIVLVVVIAAAFAAYSAMGSSAQAGSSGATAAFSRANESASSEAASGSASSAEVASSDQASSSSAADQPAQSSQGASASDLSSSSLGELAFQDADGHDVKLADVANGKVTVINIWATWCPYCVDEMHDFQGLYEKYGENVQFIMMNSADDKMEIQKAHAYVEDEQFTFPVFYDTEWNAQKQFGIRGYPTTIVIDRDGSIVHQAAGRINTQSFDAGLASMLD